MSSNYSAWKYGFLISFPDFMDHLGRYAVISARYIAPIDHKLCILQVSNLFLDDCDFLFIFWKLVSVSISDRTHFNNFAITSLSISILIVKLWSLFYEHIQVRKDTHPS